MMTLGISQTQIGEPVFIYGLSDPENGDVRYVGKSIKPIKRFRNHLCTYENSRKSAWLFSLRRNKCAPLLVILEVVRGKVCWQEAERSWIELLRPFGRLLNVNDGGIEPPKVLGRIFSRETREKLRLANTGKKCSPETKEKLRLANLGRKHSEEAKVKISAANKGRISGMAGKKHSKIVIEKMIKSRTGLKRTPEFREKMRRIVTGRTVGVAAREKMRVAKLGMVHSLEHNAAISIGVRRHRDRRNVCLR